MDFSSASDALLEAVRHLYAFDAMCDLLVVVDVRWIAQTLAEHSRRRATTTTAAALPLAAA